MRKGVTIYPKTPRVKVGGEKIQLTEKIDGSNLVLFKKEDELYIAQRKNIFALNELEEVKDGLYKGLYQWLIDHGAELKEKMNNNSAICGEWIGMGTLKYSVDEFDKRFYMFAKGNVTDDFVLANLMYDHRLFIYPFIDQVVPNYIGEVPIVCELNVLPNKEHLDSIHEKYEAKVGRPVEGFVINYCNIITKYVRYKSGKKVEYSDTDRKGE